jgi:hypothetical protein
VLDPETLQWRYHVYAEGLARLMWDEVSPGGTRVWTSPSGDDATPNDLIAYCAADIRAARAGETIPVETRIKDAVPASRITGAAFWGDRLYVAGHDPVEGDTTSTFRVWSIDVSPGPTEGDRRLELSLEIVGESEGLAVADVPGGDMDGLLHWQIQPYNTSKIPTYRQKSKLLHFRPKAETKPEHGAPERPCSTGSRKRARALRARRAHRTHRSTRR